MTTRYQSLKYAVPVVDDLNGEKTLQFSFEEKDYDFSFNPNADDPQEGATLTCVSNVEEGRINPKRAEARAWVIANKQMGLQSEAETVEGTCTCRSGADSENYMTAASAVMGCEIHCFHYGISPGGLCECGKRV